MCYYNIESGEITQNLPSLLQPPFPPLPPLSYANATRIIVVPVASAAAHTPLPTIICTDMDKSSAIKRKYTSNTRTTVINDKTIKKLKFP